MSPMGALPHGLPRATDGAGDKGVAMPPVSIIVNVATPVAALLRCLEALEANTDPALYDVVLVDDAAPADSAALLADLGGDVAVLRNTSRLGPAASYNAAAAMATGEHV